MRDAIKRSTVYFDADLHRALRVKAAQSQQTLSDIVNDAVRAILGEDREDLDAFEKRARERRLTYEELLEDLRASGKV